MYSMCTTKRSLLEHIVNLYFCKLDGTPDAYLVVLGPFLQPRQAGQSTEIL